MFIYDLTIYNLKFRVQRYEKASEKPNISHRKAGNGNTENIKSMEIIENCVLFWLLYFPWFLCFLCEIVLLFNFYLFS